MANPYLPNSFNDYDYGLTIFKPDMLLTHTQLNTLFGYLLQQDARTRTQLIGVGVVCGLMPRVVDSAVVVSRGCGVTSEGDLISLPEDQTYTQMLPYTLADHAEYEPFQKISGLSLWELFPANYTDTNETTKQGLTTNFLADKVVMLCLESQVKAADSCTGVACDNQGDQFQNKLHVLLVRKTDAINLIEPAHRQAAAACASQPRVKSRRVGVDALAYDISLKRFQTFVQSLAQRFAKLLEESYSLINRVMDPVYGGVSPIAGWQRILQANVKQTNVNANIQYVYDWLKDLFDAYEEFRQASCCWLTTCVPAETWFPKHLLLGELTVTTCQPELRHYFLRSPAVLDCEDGRRRAIWLHQRIGHLIEGFAIPVLRRSLVFGDVRPTLSTTAVLARVAGLALPSRLDTLVLKNQFLRVTPPKITPSYPRTAALGDRAMPFYYNPAVRPFWSYEKAKRCQSDDILSFHLPANPPAYVSDPFNFDSDKFSFYRIEGILNEEVSDIINVLRGLRSEYNLSFALVALRVDAQQSLFKEAIPLEVNSLEREYHNILDDIRALYGSLTAVANPVRTTRATTVRNSDTTTAEKVVTRMNLGKIKVAQPFLDAVSKFEGELVKFAVNPAVLLPSFPLENIQLDYAEFTRRRNAALSSLNKREPVKIVDALIQKLATLDRIKQAYDSLAQRTTFGNFLQANPGLEHGAGVSRGGTFVLVYKDVREPNSRVATQRVIADFYLPYIGNLS